MRGARGFRDADAHAAPPRRCARGAPPRARQALAALLTVGVLATPFAPTSARAADPSDVRPRGQPAPPRPPPADARAPEPSEGSAAAAESLFQEARRLMDAKRFSEACPKLVASHKLSPAVGTLLNLADCYERAGQNASAWARFHEAIALAQRLGRPDREKTARERADRLEPRLIRLSIVAADKDVEVKLDGAVLDPAVLGTPIPIDPGRHTIEASAKGKRTLTTAVEASERTPAPSVEIPALASLPVEAAATPPVQGSPDGGPRLPQPQSDDAALRITSYVLLGAGVVGAGVGTVFGLRTSSKWREAKTHCTGLACDTDGVTLAAQAKNNGTVSTVSFIASGVLLAGGAVLFFAARPRGSKPSKAGTSGEVRVGIGPGSVLVLGSF